MSGCFDLAVIGGGILGCTTALHAARGGMSVALLESKAGLCTQASGVNTGHIGVMSGRPYRVPHALRSMDMWADAPAWIGSDLGYRVKGGLKVAFTEAEAAALETSAAEMREHGAELDILSGDRARELEPGLSPAVRMAVLSPADGYANPLLVARAFTAALVKAGIDLRISHAVTGIEPGPPHTLRTSAGDLTASRLLLAGGVWIEELAGLLGLSLPVTCRVSQVTVTERQPSLIARGIGTTSGILSMKQVDNGTILIGGGWQGIGSPSAGPREVVPENIIGNLRLACTAVPELGRARVVRTWLGLEARVADNLPLAGQLPGHAQIWALGAVHTGFALSPCFGLMMADMILGRGDAVPDFDPARVVRHELAPMA